MTSIIIPYHTRAIIHMYTTQNVEGKKDYAHPAEVNDIIICINGIVLHKGDDVSFDHEYSHTAYMKFWCPDKLPLMTLVSHYLQWWYAIFSYSVLGFLCRGLFYWYSHATVLQHEYRSLTGIWWLNQVNRVAGNLASPLRCHVISSYGID